MLEGDEVIRPGDLLWTDFGITYLRLNTDTQHLAYVLKPDEKRGPGGAARRGWPIPTGFRISSPAPSQSDEPGTRRSRLRAPMRLRRGSIRRSTPIPSAITATALGLRSDSGTIRAPIRAARRSDPRQHRLVDRADIPCRQCPNGGGQRSRFPHRGRRLLRRDKRALYRRTPRPKSPCPLHHPRRLVSTPL